MDFDAEAFAKNVGYRDLAHALQSGNTVDSLKSYWMQKGSDPRFSRPQQSGTAGRTIITEVPQPVKPPTTRPATRPATRPTTIPSALSGDFGPSDHFAALQDLAQALGMGQA